MRCAVRAHPPPCAQTLKEGGQEKTSHDEEVRTVAKSWEISLNERNTLNVARKIRIVKKIIAKNLLSFIQLFEGWFQNSFLNMRNFGTFFGKKIIFK